MTNSNHFYCKLTELTRIKLVSLTMNAKCMNAVVAPTPVSMLASATGRPEYEWPCAALLSRMSTDNKTGNSIHVATLYLLPPTLPIRVGHTFPPTTLGTGPTGPPVRAALPLVFRSSTSVGGGRPTAD